MSRQLYLLADCGPSGIAEVGRALRSAPRTSIGAQGTARPTKASLPASIIIAAAAGFTFTLVLIALHIFFHP